MQLLRDIKPYDVHLYTSLPNAVVHKTDEIETKFTHKICSLHDKASILQSPSLWACVFGRPGFCILSFSKMRHEAHWWFVHGRDALPITETQEQMGTVLMHRM